MLIGRWHMAHTATQCSRVVALLRSAGLTLFDLVAAMSLALASEWLAASSMAELTVSMVNLPLM